ncbi:TatD family hydrolase, partial [Candidatus Peregrinibacteria bacterium]|nr:TatD family hydrolase [Candidatus Peregrinibacteria bacterium]
MKTPYAIDTHCHLTLAPKKEQNALVERAQKANVQKMISVSCTLEQIGEGLALADQHNCVWTTAG